MTFFAWSNGRSEAWQQTNAKWFRMQDFSDYRWRICLIMSCLLRYEASCCVMCSYWLTLRKKCPYSEYLASVFPHSGWMWRFSYIRTEYEDLQSKSSYSVQIWEIKDQKNSEYKHFSPSVKYAGRVILLLNM